jgi:hypothetical protein
VFGDARVPVGGGPAVPPFEGVDKQLSRAMVSAWAATAAGGAPRSPLVPTWPVMTADLPLWRVFSDAETPRPPELTLQPVRAVCHALAPAFLGGAAE